MNAYVKRVDVVDGEPLYVNVYLSDADKLKVGDIYPVTTSTTSSSHMFGEVTQAKVVDIDGNVVRMELLYG